ncbi:hypothetical protein ACF0H5_018965 [Mactra antiquata]
MRTTARIMVCFMTFSSLYHTNCDAQTIYNASDLIDDLLTNYKTVLRPVINQTDTVYVDISLALLSILEFDEVKGILHINAYLELSWTDQRLSWNGTSYNGLDSIIVESNKVWTPMIVHLNTVEKTEKIGSDDPWQFIRINSTGKTFYYPGGLFSSSCTADVTYYPYDTHICSVNLAPWGLISSELQLIPSRKEILTDYYSSNGMWNLKASKVFSQYENVTIIIQFTLERKPLFVLFNVILPIVFMTYLTTLVFLIPIDSGERISFNITMLLAVAVFLTLVGDNLPKTSSPMSIFSFYLITILALSVLFVIANIISIRCYFAREGENINKHWKRVVKISKFDFSLKCKSKHKVHADNDTHEKGIEKYENSKPQIETPKEKEQIIGPDEASSVSPISWKDVSHAVDRISFVTSLVTTFFVSIIFSAVIYAN